MKGNKYRDLSLQNPNRLSDAEDHVQQSEEVTAKLERRKERFGKPRPKKPSEEIPAGRGGSFYVSEVQANTVEVKQERPARKRRWAASG